MFEFRLRVTLKPSQYLLRTVTGVTVMIDYQVIFLGVLAFAALAGVLLLRKIQARNAAMHSHVDAVMAPREREGAQDHYRD